MEQADKAYLAAWLSALIYDDWPWVKAGLRYHKAKLIGYVDHADTQAMKVKVDDLTFLVFRGTEAAEMKFTDIIANIGYPTYWAGDGKIHSGYRSAFNRIRDRVDDMIADDKDVIVCGHSMGGALATLYAVWYSEKVSEVYTFGATKVLTSSTVPIIKAKVYRYANKGDFGPHWPPLPWFKHPVESIPLDSGGWIGPVTRHNIRKYIRCLTPISNETS